MSEIIAQKICLAKNEWNFVSWTMVCFKKSSIEIRQRFWLFVNFNLNQGYLSKDFLKFLEKFIQIWNFLVHEKWKNGLSEVIWSKIGHFSSLPEYCLQYDWKEKTAFISLNVIKKAIFPPFIYQKVLSLLEFFKKCQKNFWPVT